jgi:hypothetical protein
VGATGHGGSDGTGHRIFVIIVIIIALSSSLPPRDISVSRTPLPVRAADQLPLVSDR